MFVVEASEGKIELGIKFLKKGFPVVLPTDTLYGICADALNYRAVEKIYELKNRNSKKPLIVLISNINQLKEFFFVKELPEKVKKLFLSEEPISILLPVQGFDWITRGKGKVAFRLVKRGFIKKFLDRYGRPIVAPSANWEGFPPAKTPFQALFYFGNRVAVYYNVGFLKGKPSTLVDPFEGKILREGNPTVADKVRKILNQIR